MEYRPIRTKEVFKAKALWKQAFGDSDAYIDFNFERNLDLAFSLGCFDGRKNSLCDAVYA